MNVFRIQAMMTLGDFISGPLAAIRQSFRATGNDAEGLSGRIGAIGKRAAPFAIAAGLIIGGMTATALATAETSKALGELATLGAKDLEMFRAKAMQVSNEWAGVSAPSFISAAYDVKSALSNLSEQAQADITEMAAVASVATKASVEDMTAFIGKAYNIMGKSADFKGLSDTKIAEQLFAGMSSAVKEFMTTGPAMKQSLMSMGNAATIAGFGIKDQLVALGQLNNVMEASVAGTGFKTFVNKLPSVSEELGLNFRNAAGEMLPLPDILDMISGSVGDLKTNAAQIKIISLFGEEAGNTFKSLAEKTAELREKTVAVGAAMTSGREYVMGMARAANEHLGASIQKMNQRISILVQIIGSLFVPIISTAVQFISWLAMGFQRIASLIAGNPILRWVAQMTAMAALLASLVGLFGALSALLPGVIALVGGYATAMWTAATASLAVTWPIYAVAAAIGLLVLAFKTNFLGIGDMLRGWYNTIKLIFTGVRAVFAGLKGDTYTITGDLAKNLKAGGLVGIVTTIAGALYRFWQILRGVGDVAVKVGSIIGGILSPVWKLLNSAVGMVVSGFQNLWSVVNTIIAPIIKLVSLINPNVWRVLGIVIGTVLIVPLMGLIAPLLAAAAAIGIVIAAVWAAAKVFQGWMMLIKLVVQRVFDGWMMIANLDYGAIFGFIGRGIQSVVTLIRSINLFDAGRKLWQTFIDGIKSMAAETVNVIKSVLGKIGRFFPHSDAQEGPLSTLSLSGSRLLTTFGEGIDRAAPAFRKSIGIALAGLMPMTAGTDVSAPETPRMEPIVITAPAPVVQQESPVMKPFAPVEMAVPAVTQTEPVLPGSQIVTAPVPEIVPAGPVTVPTAPVEMNAPGVVTPPPVEMAAPEVSQAAPVVPETPAIQVDAAEVTVAAPVIEQTLPMMPTAQMITAPAPEIVPAGPVAVPAAPIVPETPAIQVDAAEVTIAVPVIEQTPPVIPTAQAMTVPTPEIVPAGPVTVPAVPVEMAAPEVTLAEPMISAPEAIQVDAAEVTVAAPVIEQTPPIMPAAQAMTTPTPEIVPARPVTVPAASVEMASPDIVTPSPVEVAAPAVSVAQVEPVEVAAPVVTQNEETESPVFGTTQLPEPVSRETVRERTVETVRRESTSPSGETRRYTITIQNLNLPNVADVQSFIEELTKIINGHDGGNG
jgi:hypothetical protein